MQNLYYLILGFGPCLFWLWWLRHKDDLEPEPKHKVLWVFLLGCLSTVPVLLLQPALTELRSHDGTTWDSFVDAFLITAVPEEFWKITAFLVGIYWHRELDEPMDGVIYGTAAGLGFASVENVIYIVRSQEEPMLWLLRGGTAVPMHVATTGGLGFFLGLVKFRPRAQAPALILTGVCMAVVFHGAYDFFLFKNYVWLALVVLLPLALVLLSLKIRWARTRSHFYHPDKVS
jgi:RsiW-degrading membrane proteinase PrsW (M82 family)